MDTAKVIRVIGYFVYTMLWMPFIVLFFVSAPIWVAVMHFRLDTPAKDLMAWFTRSLRDGVAHDKNFIETGIW